MDNATGEVTVEVPAPPAAPAEGEFAPAEDEAAPTAPKTQLNTLQKGDIVFVFEATPGDNETLYLGEFRIVSADEVSAKIEPVHWEAWTSVPEEMQFQVNDLKGAAERGGVWDLYALMPRDNHKVFAFEDLTEEEREAQLRSLLPESTIDQYLRDLRPAGDEVEPERRAAYDRSGKPLTAAALAELPPEEVEYLYVRPLRDYAYGFSSLANSIVLLSTQIGLTQGDALLMEDTAKAAKDDRKLLLESQRQLTSDRDNVRRELEIVERYLGTLQAMRRSASSRLERILRENVRLQREIGAKQADLLDIATQLAVAACCVRGRGGRQTPLLPLGAVRYGCAPAAAATRARGARLRPA